MKIIHMISGGDVGGAKTHVLSLLAGLNKTETVHLICFMEGDFAADIKRTIKLFVISMTDAARKTHDSV